MFVTVPGQKFRHQHICQACGCTWAHKAPTPMTSEVNDILHTCPNCAAARYEIDAPCLVQDLGVLAMFAIAAVAMLCICARGGP